MLPEEQKRILGYFIEEAKDHLNTIEQGLLNLQATIEDSEMVNEVFRAAHSVKGGAAMLGLETIQRTAHRLEDYFKILKESPVQTDRTLESMLLQIFDGMNEQLEQVQGPFGLTDDRAKEIMATLEPVFVQAEQHLMSLPKGASKAAPVRQPSVQSQPVSAKTTPAADTYPETSALQLVFRSDVPALLRDMLGTFKQPDSNASRSALADICQRLKNIGEQFELVEWCDLLDQAERAITNPQKSYRSLAPVVIKEIKQAQDQVMAGRFTQITASPGLLELLPPQPEAISADDASLDALLAEALSDETEDTDLTDLFAASEAAETEQEALVDTTDWLAEADMDTNPEAVNTTDFDAMFDALGSGDTGGSEDPSSQHHGGVGPEVGMAELNSLADLFEHDLVDLEGAWEEEDLADTADLTGTLDNLSDGSDSDFADLLLDTDDESETDPALVGESGDVDLSDLFGTPLLDLDPVDVAPPTGVIDAADTLDTLVTDEDLSTGIGDSGTPEAAVPSATVPEATVDAPEDGADDWLTDSSVSPDPAAPQPDDLDDFFDDSVSSGRVAVSGQANQGDTDFDNFFDDQWIATEPSSESADQPTVVVESVSLPGSLIHEQPQDVSNLPPTVSVGQSPDLPADVPDVMQDSLDWSDLDLPDLGFDQNVADQTNPSEVRDVASEGRDSSTINNLALDLEALTEDDPFAGLDSFDTIESGDAGPDTMPEFNLDFDEDSQVLPFNLPEGSLTSDIDMSPPGADTELDNLFALADATGFEETTESSVQDDLNDLGFNDLAGNGDLDFSESRDESGANYRPDPVSAAASEESAITSGAEAIDDASNWNESDWDDLDLDPTDSQPTDKYEQISDPIDDWSGAEIVTPTVEPIAVAEESADFADLEALIQDESTDLPTLPTLPETADTDFSDLDALLAEEQAESDHTTQSDQVPASDHGALPNYEDDDEFSDLEKLLEETDQRAGSTPVASRFNSPAGTSRHMPRRTPNLADQTMRVSVKHLDGLSNLVGELVVNRNSLEQDQERLRLSLDNLLLKVQQLSDVGQRMRDLYERSLLESSLMSNRQAIMAASTISSDAGNSHATGATFDALEMDRFTGFHTLSQEMIELIVRVRESSDDIAFTIDSTDEITRQFRQVTTQLQEGLNKARMVPFYQTSDRLPRAVRDISIKCGKEAKLVVEGRETLIDKMILERLYDPLTHLVNNAITHGVETPEERTAGGKSEEGTITIRAFYQGNQTVIYIADDGSGINPDVVKEKAMKRGLITAEDAQEMSELDVYELLFLPGFSTRDQADNFAGRGVGMDVVRTALADIRGSVTIESELGKGTSFTIRLPLTLSITKALSCVNNQARIAFPMDGVEDMFDVPRKRIQQNSDGQTCILWRDTLLPFRPLSDLLQFNRTLGRGRVYGGHQDDDVISIVVLRSASTYIGLQVDQVIGEQEIVIKQLEGPVPKPTGIAGATVLGDGRVMPIADVLELIDLSLGRVRRDSSSSLWAQPTEVLEEKAAKVEPIVLIVDDSITVRELLSMSFNKVGYQVEQARDGQEAWEKLRSGLPCDLVFCDIEMPRMDGLELLSRMQKDSTLSTIPIAMLTSRGADRHRQMAIELGARGYFTKPYLEEMLLDAAQRMLDGENLVSQREINING